MHEILLRLSGPTSSRRRHPFSARFLPEVNSFSKTCGHSGVSKEARAIQRGSDQARQAVKSHLNTRRHPAEELFSSRCRAEKQHFMEKVAP